jgi:nuclear pore complex protein Nup98-Nup96
LFGGGLQTTQPQQMSSLFGNTLGQPAQGSSIFGKPAAPVLGTSLSGNTTMGPSLFGASITNPPQGTLTASIAQPIGENLPIFDMLPPGPRIISLDQSLPKKKAGFFLDMPTRSPVPRVPLGYSPASSKLRGFGSTTLGPSGGSSSGISLTSGKPGALVLNKPETRGTSVGPDFLGRSSSPALGSGARQSVKKVILDKKIDPSELFVKSASPNGMKTGKVIFSPQLSVASREKDAELAAAAQSHDSSPSAPRPQASQQSKSTGGFGAKDMKETGMETKDKKEDELVEGDYWVKPELSTLKKAGYDDLSSYSKLVVGRKGYGEIHFLEPVDLTGLPKLGALLGDVIRFDDKECSVYPDSDDADKPPPGSGLNVKARLILERCWANDKATREHIKDPNHQQHVKHLKKLKNMKDTHFESFDIKTGTWTFTVDHF